MMLGVVASAIRRVIAPQPSGELWTPLDMSTVPQVYLDAHDSVVTDVSGTASAISNLGAMGADGNFVQATAANRPVIVANELNGKRVLSFDGVDDVLLGNSAQQRGLLRNTSAGWSFEVLKKRGYDASGAASRIVFDCRDGASGVRFGTLAGHASAGNQNKPRLQAARLDSGALGLLDAPETSTAYSMRLFHMNYSTGLADIYVDGNLSVSDPSMTTAGKTSDTSSTAALAVGAFNTGIVAADIDLAAIIVDRNALVTNEIDRLFGWAAHKYGLTANLPADHPYKTTAPSV